MSSLKNFLNLEKYNLLQNLTFNLAFLINFIVGICILAIFIAVAFNFIEDSEREKKTKRQKKSIVETGTMTGFFVLVYFLLKLQIGNFSTNYFFLVILGLVVMIFGTFFNIWGRMYLGKNWANQIKIYSNHSLVKSGPYKIVRHPLYASLIWMFYASSLIYASWSVFLATSFIFVPFMFYRAKQEENLLQKSFPEYEDFRKNTGMFFPRIF